MTGSETVMAVAGRRIDAEGATERFPLRLRTTIADLLEKAIADADARVLVSSAACGTDLLALDAAGRLGIRRRVVLPFDVAAFRTRSVIDRPGDWGPLFDRIISEIESANDLVQLTSKASSQSAYEQTNSAILSEGEALCAPGAATARVALVVWEGRPRGPADLTRQFLREAIGRGWSTREILSIASAR